MQFWASGFCVLGGALNKGEKEGDGVAMQMGDVEDRRRGGGWSRGGRWM
jgi:hypothetical protein